ncbi:type VII secretion protein EccE [Dactylosporangium sp. NPDC051541]|uniref:type VII secretion protein EccE n=1 Tax=Dactylosporangium sp. NPDC051541 TaxID=3363977 RepID=UPI0037B2B145
MTAQLQERVRPGRRTRIGRGRLLAIEAAAGAAIAGGALLGIGGYVLLGVAVLVLAVALGRRDGRWATDLLAARFRVASLAPAEPSTGGPARDLGAVAAIAPRLEVAECADERNADAVGVAWDGQGFAAALELDTQTPLRLDLGRLAAYAAEDDVALAGVQLLIEQLGGARANGNSPGPSRDPWPGAEVPLMRRAWVALRYEPIWAPEAARRRGEGGADGARRAVAAALARLRVRLLRHGLAAVPLDAAELTRTLRTVGDPAPKATLHRDGWSAGPAQHHCLGATIASAADWQKLLQAAAHSPAERAVLSLAVELDGPSTRTRSAVRLVSTDQARARQARQQVLDTGLAVPLPGAQAAGVLATLPLGGGPRPLTGAIGWTPR